MNPSYLLSLVWSNAKAQPLSEDRTHDTVIIFKQTSFIGSNSNDVSAPSKAIIGISAFLTAIW